MNLTPTERGRIETAILQSDPFTESIVDSAARIVESVLSERMANAWDEGHQVHAGCRECWDDGHGDQINPYRDHAVV